MEGAPCCPLKTMMSEANEIWLRGALPKNSKVCLWLRLSARENGGLTERSGARSSQRCERSNTRAVRNARTKSSAPTGCARAARGAPSAPTPPATTKSRREISLMVSLLSACAQAQVAVQALEEFLGGIGRQAHQAAVGVQPHHRSRVGNE
jgi:hypothetical protein